MGFVDIVVIVVLAVLIILAVAAIKRHKGRCGGGCSGCKYSAGCQYREQNDKSPEQNRKHRENLEKPGQDPGQNRQD